MYNGLDMLPDEPLEPVITLGNFDGVHRGHQAILGQLKEEAARLEVPTMVVTFFPHPRQLLRPEEPFVPIMSIKERLRRLYELDIDHALILPFDVDMLEMSAEEFVHEVLWESLRVSGVHVGPYMTFGHKREGDVPYLQSWGRRLGFGVGLVEPVFVDGDRVSSSRIRKALTQGQLEMANRMLGRPHRVAGVVVQGRQQGRELGFPTANLTYDGALLPPYGVYAGWAEIEDRKQRVGAVINIGVRPTFDGLGAELAIEAHLLEGFDEDVYGKEMYLGLVEHIRPEIAFEGTSALKRQIKKDVESAYEALRLTPPAKPKKAKKSKAKTKTAAKAK